MTPWMGWLQGAAGVGRGWGAESYEQVTAQAEASFSSPTRTLGREMVPQEGTLAGLWLAEFNTPTAESAAVAAP